MLAVGPLAAERKTRMLLRVVSFESAGSGLLMWDTDGTTELKNVSGLGDRVRLEVDPETVLPYVEIRSQSNDATEEPRMMQIPLPRSRPDWEAKAVSMRVMDDGAVLIAGNEFQPGGIGKVPSVWAWRPGHEASEWKQWIVSPKMLARGTKKNIWLIQAVSGFDAETDHLVCIVNKDREVGLAHFEVEFVDP